MTTSSTPAKTPTHAAASTCHVPRLPGVRASRQRRRLRAPARAASSGRRSAPRRDPLAGAADRVAVHGIADDGQHAGDGRADDGAGDAEVGRRDGRCRRGERARDQLRGGQRKTRRWRRVVGVVAVSVRAVVGQVSCVLISLSIVRGRRERSPCALAAASDAGRLRVSALTPIRVSAMERPARLGAPGAHAVGPGIHRMPLPLPNDGLRAVNVYVIEDGDGLVLIDGGWAMADATEILERGAGRDRHGGCSDIREFLVTHLHRDHYTQAIAVREDHRLGGVGRRGREGLPRRDPLDRACIRTSRACTAPAPTTSPGLLAELARRARRDVLGVPRPLACRTASTCRCRSARCARSTRRATPPVTWCSTTRRRTSCSPATTCCRTSRRRSASSWSGRTRRCATTSRRCSSCARCRTRNCCLRTVR